MKKLLLLTTALVASHYVHAQLPNQGMEQWRNVNVSGKNFELPVNWYSADSLVTTLPAAFIPNPQKHIFQTSSAHSGSLAAIVMSRNVGGTVGVLPGVLANAQVGFDLTKYLQTGDPASAIALSGGTPVSGRVGGVKAMAKYITKGLDTGAMAVRAILNNASTGNKDSLVGQGYSIITASSNYQQIFAPISYINGTVVPTQIIVAFASSAGTVSLDSSAIYVDDVDFVSVGVDELDAADEVVSLFPNPANDFLNLTAQSGESLNWQAYNLNGQEMARLSFKEKGKVDMSALPNGIYVYRVYNKEGRMIQRGKFDVLR